MTKKLFAAVLALALLCGTAGAYTYNGKDGLDWDNAYIINSFEDMDALADNAEGGRFYKLNADITLTAKPKWSGKTFSGYFDGQNHTIDYSNVADMPALFYEVAVAGYSDNPAIQKLKVKGSISTSSYEYTGGIVFYLRSGVIDSCTFTGTIRTTSSYAGGIVGFMNGGTIKNCTASGTFRASNYVGGIAGTTGMSLSSIEDCTVLSGTKISASGGSSTSAGGITGYTYYGTVKGCTSYAVLSDAQYKGGIVGLLGSAYYANNISDNRYANADNPIGSNGNRGVNNTKVDDPGTSGNNTGNTDSNTDDSSNTYNNDNSTDGNTDNDTDDSSDDDDDSGCNSGFSALMLAYVMAVKFRKH